MAHDLVAVVARLPLHTARRKPWLEGHDLPELVPRHDYWRTLAWGELDVRRLGSNSRLLPRGRTNSEGKVEGPRVGATAVVGESDAMVPGLQRRLSGMGVLPGNVGR